MATDPQRATDGKSARDKEKVAEICRRIERALQRDWGSTGKGLVERLNTAKYTVPPGLYKRIRYLNRMNKRATREEKFRLESADQFEAKGEQLLLDLAQARKGAPRRLKPMLKEMLVRHRIVLGVALVAVCAAVFALFYLVLSDPPEPPAATFTPLPRPKPKPLSNPVSKPVAQPAPAQEAAVADAPASTSVAAKPAAPALSVTAPAAQSEVPVPAGVAVYVQAPSAVNLTVKSAEVVKNMQGHDEIAVIIDVQNIGYESLKRITFDAALYDTSGAKPVAVIAPDAAPWQAFLRQAIRRGQSVEVRLAYSTTSAWTSERAIALVNSGHYQIRLKAVSLIDGTDKPLPL